MIRYKKAISLALAMIACLIIFTSCESSTSSKSVASNINSDSSQTKFSESLTAKMLKESDNYDAEYMDADLIQDFSSLEAMGINVTRANLIMTCKKADNETISLYFKCNWFTDAGSAAMYADGRYFYIVNDYEKVVYRYNLGYDLDMVESFSDNYDDFASKVSSFDTGTMNLYNKDYYGEHMVVSGKEQVYCYDENETLKYIVYYENGEINSVASINEYKYEFDETVFSVQAYHMVDTGQSIVI